jgi:H-type lectin domain
MSTMAPLTLLSAVVPMNTETPGWPLAEGEALRTFSQEVTFERLFAHPPIVQVGLSGVDASRDHNLRVRVRAEAITAAGFTLVVETWLASQVYEVNVSWLAIGS